MSSRVAAAAVNGRQRSARRRSAGGLLKGAYVRQFAWQVLGACLLGCAILVLIFLVERLEFLVGVAFDFGLGGFEVLTLAASMMPRIVDYVMPISVLLSVYFAVLVRRERRELLVLESAGIGLRPVIIVLLGVAAAASLVSFVVTAYLKPASYFSFRSALSDGLANSIVQGPRTGRFFREDDRVVYVVGNPTGAGDTIRVFSFEGRRLDELFASDCSTLRVDNGLLLSDTCGASAYRFAGIWRGTAGSGDPGAGDCPLCVSEDDELDLIRIEMGESRVPFEMTRLFAPVVRNRSYELDAVHLLRTRDGAFQSQDDVRRVFEMVLIALCTALAVSIGLVAAAATNPASRWVALPLGIGFTMVIVVVAGSGLLVPTIAFTPLGFAGLASLAVVSSLLLLPLIGSRLRLQLTQPRLGRS